MLFGDARVLRRFQSSSSSKTNGKNSRTRTKDKDDCRIVSLAEFANISAIRESLIVDCAAIDAAKIAPGKISAACGKAGYCYIEKAIQAALAGKIDGVVTAPIHKESLNLAGVKFPGHTEIFTALTRRRRSCMMLYSDKLTVSMATTHIGYHEVPKRLSATRVSERH